MPSRVTARVLRRFPFVSKECWMVGAAAAVAVFCVLLSVGDGRHGFYGPSDGPLFLAVAHRPFGNGHPFFGNPLVQGVAYRYGRILFPLTAWFVALGRPAETSWSLAVVFVVSFGVWIALAAEHLRRGRRSPLLALTIFVTPWMLLWLFVPEIVSEPMAGALVLLAYLYAREGRDTGARVAAALAVLTREVMFVAVIPLAWRAWKERGWEGLRDWAIAGVPYLAWTIWVRVRIGEFPLLDPASSRRNAFGAPFVGWYRTLVGPQGNGEGLAVLVGVLTVASIALFATRGNWVYPVMHGAVALGVLSIFYGVAVYAFPGEAYRILAPTQVLFLIAVLDRSRTVETADAEEPDVHRLPA